MIKEILMQEEVNGDGPMMQGLSLAENIKSVRVQGRRAEQREQRYSDQSISAGVWAECEEKR